MLYLYVLGEDSLMYMYLQKQYSWSLEDFTLFNVYSTVLSGWLFDYFLVITRASYLIM